MQEAERAHQEEHWHSAPAPAVRAPAQSRNVQSGVSFDVNNHSLGAVSAASVGTCCDSSGDRVVGAYAGATLAALWVSNAPSQAALLGPFHNVNANLGLFIKVGFTFSWGREDSGSLIVVFSGGVGPGYGASVSKYDTNTVPIPAFPWP
jgi:hypothetical protein